ncbi:MAG: condensation domain-containing protein, partial [Bacteroidota bacterium]|nr:condensation domain-containing protein [Bacteroidota bacterium]
MDRTFIETIDLLYLAKQNGVEIILNNEQLQLKLQENKDIDKNLLQKIKENKKSIIDFLSNENWQPKKVQKNNDRIVSDRTAVEHLPLSFAQERLWFIDQLEGGSTQFNIPVVLRLKGKLNIQALSAALHTIIERHEVLRTVYREEEGKPYQHIGAAEDWQLNRVEGTAYQKDLEALHSYIQQLIEQPFDLSRDYPIRAHLIRLAEQDYRLVVILHHIASDAWSRPILVQEVAELYSAYAA